MSFIASFHNIYEQIYYRKTYMGKRCLLLPEQANLEKFASDGGHYGSFR